MPKSKTVRRTRDRDATESRLIDALERVLGRDGFRGLGVNAVAREAGVDKVLIYRYFGDLNGLIEALGQRVDRWVGKPAGEPDAGADYAAQIRNLLREYVKALRANPTVRQILAWELVEDSPIVRELDASRSRAVKAWFARARGTAMPPPEIDAPAVNVLLLAGMHYLVLREQSIGAFAGIDLRDAESWARIERATDHILNCAYKAEHSAKRSKRRTDG